MPINDFGPARFQRFVTKTSPGTVAPRLKALRVAMAEARLDAFLIPRADAHRGESVPESEARLAYVTSFTGSAGIAVVGTKKAGLFVDSRYTLQAPIETDTRLVTVIETGQGAVDARIGDFVPKGGKLGFDPWLHTPGEIKELSEKLQGKATLVPSRNLVDQIWSDRPKPPVSAVEFLGGNRAGRLPSEKLADLRKTLAAEGADLVVLTLPESINWLLNMRGRDVPNVPVVLGFALVPQKGQPTLFVHRLKMTPDLRKGLSGIAKVRDVDELMGELEALGKSGKRVWIDPGTAPLALVGALGDAPLVEKRDPILLPKSKKNDAEIGGMKEAHRLDGIALARFLRWFDDEAPKGKLTEISIVEALEHFRREDPSCIDASFDTISGSGPNGAIIHYHVDEKSNRVLKRGELMLLDSGAQYLSGTTDITRTLFTGKASAEEKDRYTRVLKGMIALSRARFPRGTTGAQLDVLARQFLWADGVTYNHGTGHGVGAFLSVHEGPVGFGPRYGAVGLEPGMIISNEPGYYKANAFGVRIENLVLVTESAVGDGKFLELETLTLCPIDLRLIDETLLLPPERDWLNAYHKRVFQQIGGELKGEDRAWLRDATRAI